jgi:hypothetical protein
MVNEKLIIPKNNLPETATVSYYNAETGQNLTVEEWKQLNPEVSPSEIRIINQGEVYHSWKADVDYPAYGPMYSSSNSTYSTHSFSISIDLDRPIRFHVGGDFVRKWEIEGNLTELRGELMKLEDGRVSVFDFDECARSYKRSEWGERKAKEFIKKSISEFEEMLKKGEVTANCVSLTINF